MTTRALVLGGGGSIGIAWEIGVLKGVHDSDVDLGSADLIVGTSAGSVVGTQLALGRTPDALLADQLSPAHPALEQAMVFDPQTFMAIIARWRATPEMNQPDRAALGAMALAARTVDEATWLRVFEDELDGLLWPQRHLIVTGVDAENGAFVPWDRESAVPLLRAVAASCTVPGLFPAVTINGRRYIDGGVRSGTNADLARDYDRVVIIAPIGAVVEGPGGLAERQIAREVELLQRAGRQVTTIEPDADGQAAFGPNMMDAGRRGLAVEAGVRQGQAAAGQLRDFWDD